MVYSNVFSGTQNIEVAGLSDGQDINNEIYTSWNVSFRSNVYCGIAATDKKFYWQSGPATFATWQSYGPYEHDKTSSIVSAANCPVSSSTTAPPATTHAPTPAPTTHAPTPAPTTHAPTPASTTHAPTPAPTTHAATTTPPPTTAKATYASLVGSVTGLKHYYRFGEKSGTVAADVVITRPGAISGGVTEGIAGALVGDSNTAFKFDGKTGAVEVPNASAAIASVHLSIEFWAVIYTGTTGYGQMVGFRNDVDCNFYVLQLINTNSLEVRYKNSAGQQVSIYHSVSYGVWHHYALTFDGSSLAFYVDGTQQASAAASGSIATKTQPLYVGTNALGHHFSGAVDEVALYGVALTAAQVSDHYAVGHGLPATAAAAVITTIGSTGKRQAPAGGFDPTAFVAALAQLTGEPADRFVVTPVAPSHPSSGVQTIKTWILATDSALLASHVASSISASTPSDWQQAGVNNVLSSAPEAAASAPAPSSGSVPLTAVIVLGVVAGIAMLVAVLLGAAVFILYHRNRSLSPDASTQMTMLNRPLVDSDSQ